MEHYDPMKDFYQRGIEFLFKQGVAVVLSVLFCLILGATIHLLWGKMERMQTDFERRLDNTNREWSAALNQSRADWQMCEHKREALAIEVEKLKARFERYFKKNN